MSDSDQSRRWSRYLSIEAVTNPYNDDEGSLSATPLNRNVSRKCVVY